MHGQLRHVGHPKVAMVPRGNSENYVLASIMRAQAVAHKLCETNALLQIRPLFKPCLLHARQAAWPRTVHAVGPMAGDGACLKVTEAVPPHTHGNAQLVIWIFHTASHNEEGDSVQALLLLLEAAPLLGVALLPSSILLLQVLASPSIVLGR